MEKKKSYKLNPERVKLNTNAAKAAFPYALGVIFLAIGAALTLSVIFSGSVSL